MSPLMIGRFCVVSVVCASILSCAVEPNVAPDAAATADGGADATVDDAPNCAAEPARDNVASSAPSHGSLSTLSVQEMWQHIDGQRINYWPHDRYWGFPDFSGYGLGGYHDDFTWPMEMVWDDQVAARAQAEADEVAVSGEAHGQVVETNDLWIQGVYCHNYIVMGGEAVMLSSNGFMRMAVHYQDPGDRGPTLTKIGIGASAHYNGEDTVWVIRYED